MTRLVLGCAAFLFAIGTAYTFAFLADPTQGDVTNLLSACFAIPSLFSTMILTHGVA
jgi:hypothetical protein